MRKTNTQVKTVLANTEALTEVIKNAPFTTAFKLTIGIGLAQVASMVIVITLFVGALWSIGWLLS